MAAKKKSGKKTGRENEAASETRSATTKRAKAGNGEALGGTESGNSRAEFVIMLDDPDPVAADSANSGASGSQSADLLLSLSTSDGGTRQTMLLPAVCSSQDAAGIRRQLLALRQNGMAVTIDARDVEEIDTAYLQLLCAFVLDSAQNEMEVRCQCGEGPFAGAVENLGLSRQIQCF